MRLGCNGLPFYFDRKTTVITPSPLLASVVAQQFSAYQLARGLDSWERPAIYSVNAWIAACWQEARYKAIDIPLLLSPPQERVLWQRIFEEQHPDLFDLNAIAGMARRSTQLMAEWHVPSEGDLWNDHQDAEQFQVWYKNFRRKCHDEGWITRSDLWRLLPKWIMAGHCRLDRVVFAGFGTITPALEQLKHLLGNRAEIEPISSRSPQQPVPAKSCADFNHEIEQAARWARAMFEQQPSRSIGVFVPDLSSHRALVRRTFEQVFYPSAALQAGYGDASVFQIIGTTPLRERPFIASALLLLQLAHPRIRHADASAILRCPFIIGAAAERSKRALADLRLRRLREPDISLGQMEWASKECPVLTRLWPAVRRILRGGSKHLELPAWSEFIGDLLEAVGWPGDSELTLQAQELVESWKNALSVLATLGLVSGEVSYRTALAHLGQLLAAAGSEIGDWFSPVQILDAADASGLEFDCAFLTGVSEDTWPPATQLSPLVPLKLQRIHNVPGSSPASAQRERDRMTQSLFSTAPDVLATYSGRLSPAAQHFAKETVTEFPGWGGNLPRQSYTPTPLDGIADEKAPLYLQTEQSRGGTYIIKAQSLCPFRAFAEMRLNASTLEDACFGLDARERGSGLHKALQLVWQQLQTQGRLRSITDDQLRKLVVEAVNQALKIEQESPFREQNLLAERERLEELILDWLRVERNRKQPFTVETTEQERSFKIAGLDLRLRIDRVDRLKSGKLVLIDYKSGEPKLKQLEGDRPAEPQLLVYAAAMEQGVDGIFFGQLKPRDLRGVGFSRQKHFSDRTAKLKDDWDSFMRESRLNIERIAQGFMDGLAAVDPVKGACDYCSMGSFCRVHESNDREQEDEE